MHIIICEINCPSRFNAWGRVLRAGAVGWPRGMRWGGMWEEDSGWGTHVYPWLIHVNIWQKPPQYCKVISLQLKKKKKRMCLAMERVQVRSLVGNGILHATGQLSPYTETIRKNPKWRNKDLIQPNKFKKKCYEITSGYSPLSCTHSQYTNFISSVTQVCPTLCYPTDCSTPGSLVYHQYLKLAQTHVHRVGDAIQLSHPLSSPSPPAFNLS